MRKTFYFYDLETSGLKTREDRIMQFAGMRTDEDFNPIGEPTNILIKLTDDILPAPSAIMVTGITPNATLADGVTEPEFCRFFADEVATPGTTILGYNSIRFDDEFMRNTLWRNFYDPYEWQWRDGRSRWDMLDVVRMTRALRPEGINWPVTDEGKPTNRLELITKENGISHENAHDALADVQALISVTRLIKEKQPQLFDYLYKIRNKDAVLKLVNLKDPKPFVYSTGRYSVDVLHTSVAYPVADLGKGQMLVFDLRYNLDELLDGEEKARQAGEIDKEKPWAERTPWERDYFPIVKKFQPNRCPAVAPLGVLEKDDGWKKIGLTPEIIEKNLQSLQKHPEFVQRMLDRPEREYTDTRDVETKIYDGFVDRQDQNLCAVIRYNDANDLADFHPPFTDERLPELLLHYKGRHFPTAMDAKETEKWQEYRRQRLESRAPKFLEEMQIVRENLNKGETYNGRTVEDCEFLVQELELWFQSLQEV